MPVIVEEKSATSASLLAAVKVSWFGPWLAFAVLAAFWLIFLASSAPDFGGTDAYIFRDAGCNCAAGQGLVASSVPGDPASVPARLFAAYTPGAPLLFAPAAKLFGCSPRTDTYYNFTLLILLSVLVLCLYFRSEDRLGRRFAAVLLAGITLPGGLFLSDLDRPEAIALVMGFCLLLLWQRSHRAVVKTLLMGCSGLLFLTHPYVGIVEFLLFAFLLWGPRRRSNGAVFAGGLGLTIAVVVSCGLAWKYIDPTSISRFMGHAFGAGSGASVILRQHGATSVQSGFLHNYVLVGSRYFNSANVLSGAALLALVCEFAVVLVFAMRLWPRGRECSQLCGLFCILFGFPAAVFLAQPNYFAASAALLFAAIAIGGYELSDRLKRSAAPLILLLVVALTSLPQFALHLIHARELRGSYIQASDQAARVKKLFASQGIPEPRLLVDSMHFFLYKPLFANLFNLEYLQPADDSSEFQGLVRCFAPELAFSRSQLAWPAQLHKDDWMLIDTDEDVERTSLFGHIIQRRNWSWGCDVYERRSTAEDASAKKPFSSSVSSSSRTAP